MTFQPILVLLSALGLGAAHAFEPDHMAAVSTFVARRPSVRQAASFGVQWALGHGLSLIILGSVLYFLKVQILASVATGLERLVGVALLGLGIWTLFQLRPGQIHHSHSHEAAHSHGEAHDHAPEVSHTHADGTVHSHSHGHDHGHSHGRGSLWMGLLHGAAGTAAFVGEAFVAASNSYWMVLAYTVTFSVGVLLAMGAYAACLGGIISWSGHRVRAISMGAQMLTGVLACVVGVCWIQGIELPGLFSH